MANAHRSGAQAFIFVTTSITQQALDTATQLGTPLVIVDPVNRPPAGVATVGATNFRGGQDAVEHLIELGHRRIAYVGGNLESTPGGERLAGYLDALRKAGIDADPDLILPGRFNSDDGRAAGTTAQEQEPPHRRLRSQRRRGLRLLRHLPRTRPADPHRRLRRRLRRRSRRRTRLAPPDHRPATPHRNGQASGPKLRRERSVRSSGRTPYGARHQPHRPGLNSPRPDTEVAHGPGSATSPLAGP